MDRTDRTPGPDRVVAAEELAVMLQGMWVIRLAEEGLEFRPAARGCEFRDRTGRALFASCHDMVFSFKVPGWRRPSRG